jgi:xylitol oxidase
MNKRTFIKLSSAAMAGIVLSPSMSFAQTDDRLTNWAGNLTFSTNKVASPTTVDDVKRFITSHDKFKVLGTRHCFNNIADSTDQLLQLNQLPADITIDAAAHTVTLAGAVKYGVLADYLNKQGWALHNLASLPHISVAGSTATATHGSGINNGNLSSAVVGLEFITADGKTVTLSHSTDGDAFLGAVVHLGAIGVVTKITLAIQPTYQVRQDVYENLSFSQLEHNFDAIMGAGYSVSLFTDWANKNVSEVWIKSRMDKPVNLPSTFYGATPATKNLHPIVALSAENCTEQMGVPGPWHERLPHFKMGFTPSSGKELQSEYFVPREHAYQAMAAVEKLHEQITPHLFITEIRTIDGDNFWMSPCYKQPSATIHFTWKQEWPEVSKLLPQIEAALEPFNAKPHWGKLFTTSHTRLKRLYGDRFTAFQKMVKQYDPSGKFTNEFLAKNIWGV